MRRSAAPSVNSRPFKKAKFSTPFRNDKPASPSREKLSGQENPQQHKDQLDARKISIDAKECSVDKENDFLARKATQSAAHRYSNGPKKTGIEELKHDKASESEKPASKYFNVVWCKASKKKHKKWDGDGILIVNGRQAVLKDSDGKDIAKTSSYKSSELAALKEGETLFVGGKELEVMSTFAEKEYTSGRCFSQTVSQPTSFNPVNNTLKSKITSNLSSSFSIPKRVNVDGEKQTISFKKKPAIEKPRHNPDAPGAIVMPRPSTSHQWLHNKQGLPVVDVVIDPFIASHLRPHQVEGVTFLYRCIMGLGNFNGNGAILADEMGLGKTLQCIAVIWTLLKQGPYAGKSLFKRILIVTPGSLVNNWSAEFQKWLGTERLKTFPVSSDKTVEEFSKSIVFPVMIISYEMLLRNLADVKKISFNLVVCDEGHRLKNFSIKTSSAVSGLEISCMALLTGTPIQNDLKEFFALGDLCNPGIFGTHSSFRRNFETPIIRSQEPGCSTEEKRLGADRAAELKRLTDLFVLRRTSELNQAYLPPKTEYVVFCHLSTLQRNLYNEILNSRAVSMCISASSNGSDHLVCISALKKLCNHPSLLFPFVQENENLKLNDVYDVKNILYDGLLQLYPEDYESISSIENSGKLVVIDKLIGAFKETKDKCVIVSNSTKTLDVLENLLTTKNLRYTRLDGKTLTSERQRLVDNFNSNSSGIDVFLLSSKAGGTGLNLIGASRLILYDIDWNPANDIQAMARVWRDGQKKKVFIYRLLSAGTIEEKIYQRQISKQGLSGHIVDLKTNKVEFSTEDLKDLFRLDDPVLCNTHDLLGCQCHLTGQQEISLPQPQYRACQLGQQRSRMGDEKALSMAELMSWNHILPTDPEKIVDDALKRSLEHVKFVFQNQSNKV